MATRANPSPLVSVRTSLYASKSGNPEVPPATYRILPQIHCEFATVKSVVFTAPLTHGEFPFPAVSQGSFSAIERGGQAGVQFVPHIKFADDTQVESQLTEQQ